MATMITSSEKRPANKTEKMIVLRSMADEKGETKEFELPLEAVSICDFLRDIAECKRDDDCEDDDDETILEIDVPRVKGECLSKVVDFLKHHHEEEMNGIPKYLDGLSFKEIVTQTWYQDFVSDENLGFDSTGKSNTKGRNNSHHYQRMLFELVNAGNFLGIEKLLDLVVLKIAYALVGKDQEEIRTILDLPKMTNAERDQAKKDHPWVFEEDNH